MIMKKIILITVFFICFIFFLISIPAFADVNSQLAINSTQAENAINGAKADMQDMIKAGFNVVRVNDTINKAEQQFQAQLALEEKKGNPDYSLVTDEIKDVREIKNEAFKMSDELKVLGETLKEKENESVNLTQALILLDQAKKEFSDERYEQIPKIIDNCYSEISKIESESTTLRAFYLATTENLGDFLKRSWLILISISFGVVVTFAVGRNAISRHRIKSRIKKLEIERAVINDLVKKTQKDYFEKGDLSESSYKIKIKKFDEIIRDIDRQIPILKEELIKKKGKITGEKEKKEEREEKVKISKRKVSKRKTK